MRNEGTPDLADKVSKWVTIAVMVSGLGIGAFILEARHSIQSEEIKQLIQDENQQHTKIITETVIQVLRQDLQLFRDSISQDHDRLMNANFRKDSLLLIVIPRMLEQTKDATNTVKRIESTILSQEKNDLQPIYEYLRQRDERDSILSRDAAIMRELRAINRQLMQQPKYDRVK